MAPLWYPTTARSKSIGRMAAALSIRKHLERTAIMTINHDDDAFTRDVASRIKPNDLEGKAPWLKDHLQALQKSPTTLHRPALSTRESTQFFLILLPQNAASRSPLDSHAMRSQRLTPNMEEKPVALHSATGLSSHRYQSHSGTLHRPFPTVQSDQLYYVYNAEQIRACLLAEGSGHNSVKMKTQSTQKHWREAHLKADPILFQPLAQPQLRCKETLAAIAKYRLACQLRLSYKAEVNLESAS